MRKEAEIPMTPKQASDPSGWKAAFAQFLHIPAARIRHINPVQRSVDARGQKVKVRLKAELYIDEVPENNGKPIRKTYTDVTENLRSLL